MPFEILGLYCTGNFGFHIEAKNISMQIYTKKVQNAFDSTLPET